MYCFTKSVFRSSSLIKHSAAIVAISISMPITYIAVSVFLLILSFLLYKKYPSIKYPIYPVTALNPVLSIKSEIIPPIFGT